MGTHQPQIKRLANPFTAPFRNSFTTFALSFRIDRPTHLKKLLRIRLLIIQFNLEVLPIIVRCEWRVVIPWKLLVFTVTS